MSAPPILLKVLLRQRHWQKYSTFCSRYDHAARTVDPDLVGTWPSRAQLHRWLTGTLRGLPYPDHCRVLEAMFPGWKAHQLLASCPASVDEVVVEDHGGTHDPGVPALEATAVSTGWPIAPPSDERFSDLYAVFPTRSQFMSAMPPQTLLTGAKSVRAAGLSLNLICQHFPEQHLCQMIREGTTLRCLFLDPMGEAIKLREREEGHPAGLLTGLTELNVNHLVDRVRSQLAEDDRGRLEVRLYDEIIRFNILLVDGMTCVVQPYLSSARGVESPTLVLRKRWSAGGLFPIFEQVLSSLWDRSRSA